MQIVLNFIDLTILFALWLFCGWALIAISDKVGKKLKERRHRKELVRMAVWMTCHKGRV